MKYAIDQIVDNIVVLENIETGEIIKEDRSNKMRFTSMIGIMALSYAILVIIIESPFFFIHYLNCNYIFFLYSQLLMLY